MAEFLETYQQIINTLVNLEKHCKTGVEEVNENIQLALAHKVSKQDIDDNVDAYDICLPKWVPHAKILLETLEKLTGKKIVIQPNNKERPQMHNIPKVDQQTTATLADVKGLKQEVEKLKQQYETKNIIKLHNFYDLQSKNLIFQKIANKKFEELNQYKEIDVINEAVLGEINNLAPIPDVNKDISIDDSDGGKIIWSGKEDALRLTVTKDKETYLIKHDYANNQYWLKKAGKDESYKISTQDINFENLFDSVEKQYQKLYKEGEEQKAQAEEQVKQQQLKKENEDRIAREIKEKDEQNKKIQKEEEEKKKEKAKEEKAIKEQARKDKLEKEANERKDKKEQAEQIRKDKLAKEDKDAKEREDLKTKQREERDLKIKQLEIANQQKQEETKLQAQYQRQAGEQKEKEHIRRYNNLIIGNEMEKNKKESYGVLGSSVAFSAVFVVLGVLFTPLFFIGMVAPAILLVKYSSIKKTKNEIALEKGLQIDEQKPDAILAKSTDIENNLDKNFSKLHKRKKLQINSKESQSDENLYLKTKKNITQHETKREI